VGSGDEGQTHEKTGSLTARANISSLETVERGLNEMRLAVLGILVGIGLTVGFGVPVQLERCAGSTSSRTKRRSLRFARPTVHCLLHRLNLGVTPPVVRVLER
jgi:hypothetical protein